MAASSVGYSDGEWLRDDVSYDGGELPHSGQHHSCPSDGSCALLDHRSQDSTLPSLQLPAATSSTQLSPYAQVRSPSFDFSKLNSRNNNTDGHDANAKKCVLEESPQMQLIRIRSGKIGGGELNTTSDDFASSPPALPSPLPFVRGGNNGGGEEKQCMGGWRALKGVTNETVQPKRERRGRFVATRLSSFTEALERLTAPIIHLKHDFIYLWSIDGGRIKGRESRNSRQFYHRTSTTTTAAGQEKSRSRRNQRAPSYCGKNSSSSYPSDSDSEQNMAYASIQENEANKKRWRRWTFWTLIFLLAALTVRDVSKLVIEYLGNPKKADISIVFNESMTMPNITFCMSRAQAWSHFRLNLSEETPEKWDAAIQTQLHNMTDRRSFLSMPWDFHMVMESYNLISALTSMEQETEVQGAAGTIQKFSTSPKFAVMRKNLATWLGALAERKVTFDEWVQKTGKETLRRSMQRFQRTTYKEDQEVLKTGMRISWISQLQLCFQPQFDQENYKTIDQQGAFFTMVLSHNAEKLEGAQVDCMNIDLHGRPSSMSRLSGHKGEARDGFDDELCLGQRHETTVEVKARYKLLENDDEGKRCKEIDPGEDDQHECQARCRMEFIRGLCKCTPPSLSYLIKEQAKELAEMPLCNYSSCPGVDAQRNNYTDGGCASKCRRNCLQLRYQLKHESKGRNVRPDLTTVYLNWGSFEYINFEQDWQYTTSSFIAAIGGAIGMWLGLSILSLIQGSNFLFSYCTAKVAERRTKKQRVNSMDTEEEQKQTDVKNSIGRKDTPFMEGNDGVVTKTNVLAAKRNILESPFKQSLRQLTLKQIQQNREAGGQQTPSNPTSTSPPPDYER